MVELCPNCADDEPVSDYSSALQTTMIGSVGDCLTSTSAHFRRSWSRPENPQRIPAHFWSLQHTL